MSQSPPFAPTKKDGKGAQGREEKGGQGSPCGEKLPKNANLTNS